MARKTVEQCRMPECTNDVQYPSLKVCHACYSFMHYWKDRSVGDRLKHVNKIERWSARAHATLLPARVSTISTKRAKRRRTG